jgi:hypothetical protein
MDYRGNADPNNAFAKLWADWANQMMGAGFSPPGDAREAMLRQMRQAFFDAWARCCEEFLGSDAFLDAMKKSMDGALAFRQQLNEFMTRALHEAQAPARSDTDSIMLVLHGLEERVLSRLEDLAERVAALEETAYERSSRATGASGESSGRAERPSAKKAKGGAR